jgi:HD-GYP domain-containing protein (c-di-GMP phosphodiesterase class II)
MRKFRWSLAQRTYALSVLPVILVLAGSFLALDHLVRQRTAADLRQNLLRTETLLAEERHRGEQRMRNALSALAESAGLKPAVTLLREVTQSGAIADPAIRTQIQATLDTQLKDIQRLIRFDLYVLADATGQPLASIPTVPRFHPGEPILTLGGRHYSMVSVPINTNNENIGFIAVGEKIDFEHSPGALLHGRDMLATSIGRFQLPEGDPPELKIGGETYVASYDRRGAFTLVRVRPISREVASVLAAQRVVLLAAGAVALLLAIVVAFLGTRSLTRPLRQLTEALTHAGNEGRLPREFARSDSTIEVSLLIESFAKAATAIEASNRKLEQAYVDFMGALAEALDARDPYTAGHSRRVADYSVLIARAMQLDRETIDRIYIGGMLHDIGKIGVPDAILLSHERLTDAEFAVIREHPSIGKRILERIGHFERFLPAVELHHENHDGTGYPHGLAGHAIPIDARIIHVADAYDAMTSNRPYRQRMPEEKVRRILAECAGTQFDPEIARTFLDIGVEALTTVSNDLEKLSHAISASSSTLAAAAVAGAAAAANDGHGGAPVGGDFSQRAVQRAV